MKKVILCILDGWGHAPASAHNAITLASTPNFDKLQANHPSALLNASGAAVGLPAGQMGNSEVGHITIGAGRVIWQDLPRISSDLENGEFFSHPLYKNMKTDGKTCHLIGLISDGGVHSHIDHIIKICNDLRRNSVDFKLHAITDGRDTAPQSALQYLKQLADCGISPSTISGRFYAMDRDNRWERTENFYQLLTNPSLHATFTDATDAITAQYERGIYDEFIMPIKHESFVGINDGEAVLMMNFRADRMRQISKALFDPEFTAFKVQLINYNHKLSLTSYCGELAKHLMPLSPSIQPQDTLGEVVALAGGKQLRIAETEKYAHVTYFLNGGREAFFDGEERVMIASPKVATYDLEPAMSAAEITAALVSHIQSNSHHFICVNYANADMVGHSGQVAPTKLAIEAVDDALGYIIAQTATHGYELLVTADHGNAECLLDDSNGQPLTSHTLNPVPLIYVGMREISLLSGSLQDVAPTVLDLMGISKPIAMTGTSLIIKS